ncbi:MAG: hydroxyacylglutathione hydrolase [Kiritimatiellae bacterium]|nr:hydroxyacylglutathione hydrolase [Kiritimatiellia bacterium]
MWMRNYDGLVVALLPWEDNVFCVLLRDGGALVVDPPVAAPVSALLRERGASLDAILITHADWDHIGGVPELISAHAPTVYGPEGATMAFVFRGLRDGETLNWRGLEFRALDTRGHRPQHVAFYAPAPAPGLLFSGDSLFAAGCGRIFANPPEWMFTALQKLAALPRETHVYCGHDYLEDNLAFALSLEPDNTAMKDRLADVRARHQARDPVLPSTLALEWETNPFLRARDVETFAKLRRAKDSF